MFVFVLLYGFNGTGKSFAALAAGTSALASSVKSLLTRSFDEGLTVQDDEVALMISQIAQLQQAIPSRKEHALKLVCPSDAFSMDLPPILNLIDAISDLESALSEEVAKAATSHAFSSGACLAAGASYGDGAEQLDSDVQNTSGSCDDSADLSQDLSASDLEPEDLGLDSSLVAPDDAEVENIRVCATKEAEVAEMLALTEAVRAYSALSCSPMISVIIVVVVVVVVIIIVVNFLPTFHHPL